MLATGLAAATAHGADGRLERVVGDRVGASASGIDGTITRTTWVTDDGRRIAVGADQAAAAARGAPLPHAVVGPTPWLTLLCRYADIATEPMPLSAFAAQATDVPGAPAHYWQAMSQGAVSLAGSKALGWFALPQARSHYVAGGSVDLNALFADCTATVDTQVDFRDYDGINIVLNADLDGRLWGGAACVTLDGVARCWRATWTVAFPWLGVAGLAHEMGHGYGLPHVDNGDGDATPYDSPWDPMSNPWSHGVVHPLFGALPQQLSAYSRDRLGWIAPARRLLVDRDGAWSRLALRRPGVTDASALQAIVLHAAGEVPSRRYTVEARRRDGSYDAALAGEGVVLHAVDDDRAEPAHLVDTDVPPGDYGDTPGAWLAAGESWRSPDGSLHVHVDADLGDGYVVTVLRGDARLLANDFE